MPRLHDVSNAAQNDELYDELRIGCRAERIAKTIDRLLDEAPKTPGQTPAIECAVLLSGNDGFVAGALAKDGHGGLKMLLMEHNGATELFFDYASVVALGVKQAVSSSSIVRS